MFKRAAILLLLAGAITAVQLRGDDEPLARQKRQIPESTFPTFGPDVERTADGVPILDESYLERRDRPAARFFSQFEQPQTDTEGLRLYEDLLGGSSGGRPQLRSLDTENPFAGQFNGLSESSHSTSKTRKVSSRRTSRKSIQVKSAGSTSTVNAADLPSGFGPSTGPQFSEEVNYQRTTNANKRRNAQLRSLDSGNGNSHSCVTCRRRLGSGEGATELKTLTRSNTVNSQGHETEGLRLYRKLLRNGTGGSSRNQLRSLDNGDDNLPQNGILPHHRQSAAWSEKEESHQSFSRNHSRVSVRNGDSAAEHTTTGSGPQLSEETNQNNNYRRSNGGRRSHTRNASRTRSLSSTHSSSANNGLSNGASNCVTCQTRSQIQTRSSASNLEDSPVTYHRTSRVPSTGDYLIPTPAATSSSGSSSWAEREERSHHSSRTVSRTINGVETNGLGEPLHSEEQATYRRVASGGTGINGNENGNDAISTRSNIRSGARTLSTAEHEQSSSAAATHSTSSASDHSSSSGHRAAARTLSVAGLSNTNGNGRARRYNCSRISTTSLSEGAQSVSEIVTPPPCVIRRSSSSSDNQLNTRASTRSLDLPYPPVQTLGRGDLEVHARVLESDHENEDDSAFNLNQRQQFHSEEEENHEESASSTNTGYVQPTQTSYRTGRKHKKAFYRRTVFKNYTTSEYPASVETWLGA